MPTVNLSRHDATTQASSRRTSASGQWHGALLSFAVASHGRHFALQATPPPGYSTSKIPRGVLGGSPGAVHPNRSGLGTACCKRKTRLMVFCSDSNPAAPVSLEASQPKVSQPQQHFTMWLTHLAVVFLQLSVGL